MRLKHPPQPLVFSFRGVSSLCGAVSAVYELLPQVPSSLCLYRGIYFLALQVPLRYRIPVAAAATEFGAYLGPGAVLYAFFEEHGQKISSNVVALLGKALNKR